MLSCLGVKVAFEPDNILKATDNIDTMQEMISELIDKGHAYVGPDGVVYFSVDSFDDYGKAQRQYFGSATDEALNPDESVTRISRTRNTRRTSCYGRPTRLTS